MEELRKKLNEMRFKGNTKVGFAKDNMQQRFHYEGYVEAVEEIAKLLDNV
jgi:hypothetical protein